MKSSWIGKGFSHQRVPSLSNTETRSAIGTPAATVASTKPTIASLAGPGFQLGSSSVTVHLRVGSVNLPSQPRAPVLGHRPCRVTGPTTARHRAGGLHGSEMRGVDGS